jgi:hypothetical protein
VDGVKQIRTRRSGPPPAPNPVSRGEWILAIVLSLRITLYSAGWILGRVLTPAPSGSFDSSRLDSLAMFLVDAGIVAALDISLLREAAKLRRKRP